ncbi:MAG TPA: hypothetical protein VES68_00260 [Candidatus Sulfotelmatobacter sp.]|nr:hypothetical protein [Candidatus Sulfotelmatobacter sp.]
MNKVIIASILIILSAYSSGSLSKIASAESINLDNPIRMDQDSNIFASANIFGEENKEKTQFRTKDNKNQYSQFSIKGVISSSASDSITIDNKLIKIDSSVTGDVKIVGTTSVGSYAMVKGIIKDSILYAQKIVVDQRNKKELQEDKNDNDNDEDELSPSPTLTPSITLTPTPTGTVSADIEGQQNTNIHFDLGKIILSVENFLNYLKDIAQKI